MLQNMEQGNNRVQYYIVSALSTAAITNGVSRGWATPVLPMISRNEVGFPISKEAISWMVSIASVGVVIGSCLTRITSDKWGRRTTILGSSLAFIAGSILKICAWNAWMLFCGRALWGLGMGMIMAVSAIYFAEISHKDIRGRISLSARFMASFGMLLVMAVGAFVSYQTLNYMMLSLPVIFVLVCWWIPESPYYLLKEGKVEAARKTLRLLTGLRNEDVSIEEKISQLQSHVQIEMRRSSSLKEFLTGKQYRKAIFIVIGIRVPQIMTGLHAIQNYLGPILMESGSGISITTALIVYGMTRFLLGVMSSVLVDILGRRPLLVGSFFGTGVLLVVTGVYFGVQERYDIAYPYTLIPFIFIIVTIIISILGFESVAYLVPAEVFPMNVKSIALAMSTVFGGLANFISVKTYQGIKDGIGLSGVFVTYSCAAFIGAAFCYFYVPETKGKSLKEIQIELNGTVYDEEVKLNKVDVNEDKEDVTKNVNCESKHEEVSPLNSKQSET